MKKLNLGCGDKIVDGWVNVDRYKIGDNQIVDITKPLPFSDGEFDFIVANHTLSMLDYQELPACLKELKRILKIDGVLRIIDFDPVQCFESYKRKDEKALIIPDDVEPTLDGKFCAYLTWYGTRKSLLTKEAWVEKLQTAGFVARVSAYMESNSELDSREHESNFIEGTI